MRRIKRLLKFAILLILVAGAASASVAVVGPGRVKEEGLDAWRKARAWSGLSGEAEESGTVYWCPMHPQIKRKQTGTCPLCNMALVPLEAGASDRPPTHLTLTVQQVQQSGVVTEPVLTRTLERTIDTTGRVEVDERRMAKIASWIPGKSRIVDLRVNYTGELVKPGEVMAELYSPELISAQSEYLIARQAEARMSARAGSALGDSARQKLLYWGLTPAQIDRLVQTGKVLDRVPISAPIGGTVHKLLVREGQYVTEGDLLFEVVDLSRLWLIADVYEDELPLVELGQTVTISVRSLPGETFTGRVAFIDYIVTADSRTVRVRMDLENPGHQLKPGMYARVEVEKRLPEILAVPSEAVIWSGQRSVVLMKRGKGTFEPREVKLGQKWLHAAEPEEQGGRGLEFGAEQKRYHEVKAGLKPGDSVVTAGAFLLNAESQFQSVLTKMLPAEGTESPGLEALIGEAPAKDLRAVLEAYYALSRSLSTDALGEVPERSNALSEAADRLARDSEKPDLQKAARRVAGAASATELRLASDLEIARRGFGTVSKELVALLADFGGSALLGDEIHAFECPMAGKFGYKVWLQDGPELKNPYMGPKMLTCGKELDALQP